MIGVRYLIVICEKVSICGFEDGDLEILEMIGSCCVYGSSYS